MLFTRCPDCETTFRITADALRKADGQVRCGRCARVFNAYNELRRPARRTSAGRRGAAAATSADALAPKQDAVSVEGHAAAAESNQAEATPARPGGAAAAGPAPDPSRATALQKLEPPPPAAHDARSPVPVSSSAAAAKPSTGRTDAGSADAAAPAEPRAVRKTESRVSAAPAAPGAKDTDSEKDVVVGDISLAGVIAELEASAAADDAEPIDAAKPEDAAGAPPAGSLLGKNGLGVAASPAAAKAGQGSAADGAGGDGLAAPAWVILDETPTKRAAGSRAWAIGTMAACALLALQVVHHYRSQLAVAAVVGPAVRDAYAMLGVEIAPDWNLDQYEIVVDWDAVTQPSADEQGHLKIAARIRNKGPSELPLPHVQVELKDRWESTLGSRVFAPVEYLPSGTAVHRPMTAGQIAVAELAILDPGPQAYGFELDVCVGSAAGGLRCAADEVFH